EGGAAGGEIGVDAELVVDAGESGVDGRRFGLALGGIGFSAEGGVFGYGDDDPAGGVVCILRSQRTGGTENEQAEGCEEQFCFSELAKRHDETVVRGSQHRLYLT